MDKGLTEDLPNVSDVSQKGRPPASGLNFEQRARTQILRLRVDS